MNQVFSFEFISRNWSWFLMALLALFCCTLGIYRIKERTSLKNKKDLIVVQKSLERFQEGYFLDVDSLETIENIVSTHPELHTRFDFLLAESYLSTGKVDKALAIAKESFKRTDPFTSKNFQLYAATSLLIAENKLGQALNNAETLENELREGGVSSNEMLRAFNLLRIVFLAKESGNEKQLNDSWEVLNKLPTFETLNSYFSEGKVTLKDYIYPVIEKNKQ